MIVCNKTEWNPDFQPCRGMAFWLRSLFSTELKLGIVEHIFIVIGFWEVHISFLLSGFGRAPKTSKDIDDAHRFCRPVL